MPSRGALRASEAAECTVPGPLRPSGRAPGAPAGPLRTTRLLGFQDSTVSLLPEDTSPAGTGGPAPPGPEVSAGQDFSVTQPMGPTHSHTGLGGHTSESGSPGSWPRRPRRAHAASQTGSPRGLRAGEAVLREPRPPCTQPHRCLWCASPHASRVLELSARTPRAEPASADQQQPLQPDTRHGGHGPSLTTLICAVPR